MKHYFDYTCQSCNTNFLQEDFEIYSLTLDKICKICNISYKADKPWYYNCKDCSKKLPHEEQYKTTQCIYCKEEFYKNIKTLNIVSGYYQTPNHTRGQTTTYRRIIPSHLREDEKKITQGTHFYKSVCYNHLSLTNKQISDISNKKALKWSQNKSYPPLFRLKCLKISLISIHSKVIRNKLLKIMDNCFLALTVLLNNDILPELRQIILKIFLI
jgi:hypothetical protein